jgi:PHP family Zn ribbon phosphoesterase
MCQLDEVDTLTLRIRCANCGARAKTAVFLADNEMSDVRHRRPRSHSA